ncbi:hypothetical protein AM493_09135 [Flavobacterium akiainvivens]|uniref:Phosphodiester glycosidase domain-containing protein n=1 Tax=Flavobacterium akiainvivens TaxID=1202724 RepID=A0A0M9VI17_9FLAO|nr:phosphodiester glycosidase family protein [Flavobacterium akiainvivens]KOS06176.1 hypothetical protein AM493_09135 [Flavobacterium akiainvivens]SFQ68271.1 Uncharacterized protein YigE, DUF2233 family [Flavobacterium akiainvivens]
MKKLWLLVAFVALGSLAVMGYEDAANDYISYTANLSQEKVILYYKDAGGKRIKSLGNLKKHVEASGQTLLFAMNGGMYSPKREPVGLYIEDFKTLSPADTASGKGNFYLKPNGIFYIDGKGKAGISKTEDFKPANNIKYATQSGPMLVINGAIHPAFKEGSDNVNIRNGVGILPDGSILLCMSKEKVNFYDFAQYFKNKGCKNALYLDGYVSRTYAPSEKWEQTDGNFGVIIGVIKHRYEMVTPLTACTL